MKTSLMVVANQKGGVGKTTTVVNLAAAFTTLGKNVLVIDLDPQCHATMGLGLEKTGEGAKNVQYAIRNRTNIDEVVKKSKFGIDVVPGSRNLDETAQKILGTTRQFKFIEQLLETKNISKYDLVLIDTRPSLDVIFLAAMAAAHYYILPLFAEEYSVEGLVEQINAAENVRIDLNKPLTFLGAIITSFMKSNKNHIDFEKIIRQTGKSSGFKVLNTVIPYSESVGSAQKLHLPLNHYRYAKSSPVWHSYMALAGELQPHLKGRRIGRRFSPINTNAILASNHASEFETSVEI